MDRQQNGSEKWQPSAWRQLLELVLPALEDLPQEERWTLGGGTALAISLKHRISYDIDIFFQNADALKLLSPNKNRKIRSLSDNWQQPGHYLKIERPEGDIDFLVTRMFTEKPFFLYEFCNKKIPVEKPAEIISKKIYYRASQFTVRDIFDLAVFSASEPAHFFSFNPDIREAIPRVLDRIKCLRKRYENTIHSSVFPTEFGKKFLENGADIAINILESI
jgi:hypothetical protein